jgi:hypothetical protein
MGTNQAVQTDINCSMGIDLLVAALCNKLIKNESIGITLPKSFPNI